MSRQKLWWSVVFFDEDSLVVKHSRTSTQKICPWRNFFCSVVEIAFKVSWVDIWEETSLKRFVSFKWFLDFEQKHNVQLEKTFGLVWTRFLCAQAQIEGRRFPGKEIQFFYFCQILHGGFSHFRSKRSGSVFKTAFIVSRKKLSEIFFKSIVFSVILDLERNFFKFLAKNC